MESNETHCPLGLIDGPWLSPLPSTPPGPMLIRSTESIVGGAPAVADGVRVVRKMSECPLLSFGTRLLAAEAKTALILLLAVSTATARFVHLPAFCALHWSVLPVGSTFRSPPASGMLMRSRAPPGAARAVRPEKPAAVRTRAHVSATEDRDRLMV